VTFGKPAPVNPRTFIPFVAAGDSAAGDSAAGDSAAGDFDNDGRPAPFVAARKGPAARVLLNTTETTGRAPPGPTTRPAGR
jgi:hypothetical protein